MPHVIVVLEPRVGCLVPAFDGTASFVLFVFGFHSFFFYSVSLWLWKIATFWFSFKGFFICIQTYLERRYFGDPEDTKLNDQA